MIITLASIGLLWPLSKALGITDSLPPIVIGSVWLAIRVLWIVIVLATHNKKPFWTLLLASCLYEIVAIIPQQLLWDGEPAARIPAAIATLIMGVITGVIIGGIAQGLRRFSR